MPSININALFTVKDMVFVITGGGSGLGAMMASALDANGAAKVFILGRRQESLDKVASKATSGTIIPIVCDIGSKESLSSAVASISKQTPFINTLIANSGVSGPATGFVPRPLGTLTEMYNQLWDTSLSEHNSTVDINIVGSFFTFVAFLPLLDAGNSHPDSIGKNGAIQSQVINTTSFGGLSRSENVSHVYAASKAALVHLTKSLSTTFAPWGIRANSISPGLFLTEMTEFATGGKDLSVPGSMPKEAYPATRSGGEEDIAGAVLFMASRAGAFVNGNILVLDGGMLSVTPGSY